MADPHRTYEIRCPVHGFIEINDWEREIINQPAFQRLRRIRQLAWTDQVYPGAMHTRFEHSLGVMHVASLLFDAIRHRSREVLRSVLHYDDLGLDRDRALVRLAALLHDVGHGPFSHAAEELMPQRDDGPERYSHEDYSTAAVRRYFADVIENHPLNTNRGFQVEDVASLLEGTVGARKSVFWRELIVGQMDADRMDYLLRDSLHTGVEYGQFPLRRLITTVRAVPLDEGAGLRLGVSEGGWHAAEELILARRSMFTQVYFHKTRVAYDHHLLETLKTLLTAGCFPPPVEERLEEYLQWDDWKVLGSLADGKGGEHGKQLATRDHFREVYETPEVSAKRDLTRLQKARQKLGSLLALESSAARSWYKRGSEDIPVIDERKKGSVRPLSNHSTVVAKLAPNTQVRLFARPEECDEARRKLQNLK